MEPSIPALVVTRRARTPDSGWYEARSWLGGSPRLGGQPWPRKDGVPLNFVAQIDWRDVHAGLGLAAAGLPERGALAFFLPHCAVVGVPPGDHPPTPPPSDTPIALFEGGDLFPEEPAAGLGIVEFPYWPVELAQPPADGVKGRYFLGARQLYEAAGIETHSYWWHSARHVAACMRTALHSARQVLGKTRVKLEAARAESERTMPRRKLTEFWKEPVESKEHKKARLQAEGAEKDIERLEKEIPVMERQSAEADAWTGQQEDWTLMEPADVERLRDLLARCRETRAKFWVPHRFEDLESATLIALATAPEEAYRTMPEGLRNAINEGFLTSPNPCHQMFGEGVDIQNALWENEGNHLLLQLMYDDMLRWIFGDMGAFQYWISPKDLDARNWAGATVTFECH